MAYLSVSNVAIKGISACVPLRKEENRTLPLFLNEENADKFIATTGVERRRVSSAHTTTSDLCYHAAEKLISELNWDKQEIGCLLFVSQTPDYILPATSCILQERLGFNEECYTIDISLGCSGWVYGMSVISNLLSNGSITKGLLLVGDTCLSSASPEDKSSWPLFGDAGTATALEYDPQADQMKFHLATDGSGAEAIIIPDGGYRNVFTEDSLKMEFIEDGIKRSRCHTILNGMDVFSFGISKAPQSVNKVLEYSQMEREDVDYYLFHQANKFMNEKIRKKLKLTEEQVPYSLKNFGNTSSATIPLTMVTEIGEQLQNEKLKMIGCGFGVGLSWGSVSFSTNKICIPKLIEI